MKIVLIEPRATEATVYSRLQMPLLGPVYLGTILKNRGHEVRVYNEDIYTPDYSKLDADLIGISILTPTAKRGYEVARKFPKEKVIIGGVHASLLPDEALTYARQVVVGEAEEVIVDVAEGRIKDNIVQGRPVQDLDSLPFPDYSLVQGYKLPAFVTPISTSRGCPFDCSFCSVTKMFGRKYRFRSAQSVVSEVQSQKTRNIFFCDDNFTAYHKRTFELLRLMLKSKVKPWAAQVRCDVAKNPEVLDLMSRAGCKIVFIGFESVNPVTLQSYQKHQTVDDIIHAVRAFHSKRIKVHGMFVLGGEGDNKQAPWETLKFAIKHKIDTIQMMILTPAPGTKIYDDLKAQNRIFTRDWDLYDGQHIVFNPKQLSPRELQQNVMLAYAKFYSLRRGFVALVKLRFANALFYFMGHKLVKEFLGHNRSMKWLPSNLKP